MPEDRIVPIRNMPDGELLDKILSNYKQAKSDKSEDIARNQRYRHILQALDPPELAIDETGNAVVEDKSKFSNTYLAVGASTVETATVNLYNHLFSIPNYMEIDGDNWEDDAQALAITAHLLKRHEQMRFKVKVYEALQMCCCFDYCVTLANWKIKPGYVNKRKTQVVTESYGGVKLNKKAVEMVTEWVPNAIDRSDFQVIDFFSCYPDISSKNGLEDSTFFIDVYNIPVEELVEKRQADDSPWGAFKNVEKVILRELENAREIDNPDDPIDRGKIAERLEVIRYWTHDQVIEVCSGFIIRRTNIDGMPLQLWKLYNLPSEFKGMGVVQRIERNQHDINAIINIKRDFQNLQLTPITIIDEDLAGQGEGDVELYAGRTFIKSGHKQMSEMIKFQQPGVDISQGATEELAVQKDSIREVSGFGENQSGTFSKGRKTAREALVVQAGSMSKVAVIAERMELDCLIPVYERHFKLEQMNLSEEHRFAYQGADGSGWLVIRPEDYRWRSMPRFSAKGTSHLVNEEMATQQFMLAMDRQFQYAPDQANVQAIMTKMWERLDPKDYQNFIKDPRVKDHNVPANIENQLLAMGHKVEISEQNNHSKHRASHNGLKNSPDYQLWPEHMKLNLEEHIQAHDMAEMMTTKAPAQVSGGFQDESDQLRGQRGSVLSGVQ